MKSVILILSFIILSSSMSLPDQSCVIKCQEFNPANKTAPKGVPFSLIIKSGKKNLTLASNQSGELIIAKTVYTKIKNELILSFNFINPSDHEYYGTPYQLYNKKVKLSDICGKTLTVDRIW